MFKLIEMSVLANNLAYMHLPGEARLIECLGINDTSHLYYSVDDLSTASMNIVQRALLKSGKWKFEDISEIRNEYSKPIAISELEDIRIFELRDMKNVGETRIEVLVSELTTSVGKYSGYIQPSELEKFPDSPSISSHEVALENAESLEELTDGMILYIKSEFEIAGMKDSRKRLEIDARTEFVWRNRLTWLTGEPLTLEEIANELGVTRERVRQIQNLASRYPFSANLKVRLLDLVHEVLIESANAKDFLITLKDEGLISDENVNIGIFRSLAKELNYVNLTQDIEKSIYKWASSII